MEDFTSSALLGLVRAAFARRGLVEAPSLPVGARTPVAAKRSLLERGFERFGADGILAVGQEVVTAPWSPVLTVFRRAPSAPQVLARWRRLERYFHSRHRVRVLEEGPNSALLEHHATRGPAPALVEDLLIAGVLAGLVLDAGARGLDASLEPGACFLADGRPLPLSDAPVTASRLRLRWDGFANRHPQSTATREPDQNEAVARLRALVAADTARAWRLADAAAEFEATPRTLQRRLTDAGTSFRAIVRNARAEDAARLVAAGVPLAETGFACGYADQAHFTREFRACVGLAPGAYRDSLDGQERAPQP